MSEESLELYRQRYETWRHLDRLRYSTIQITVGGAGAVIAALEILQSKPAIWIWFAFAIFLFVQWKSLGKINDAIIANGAALSEYGRQIGDDKIPNTSERIKSVFYYVEWIVFASACISLVTGITFFIGILLND